MTNFLRAISALSGWFINGIERLIFPFQTDKHFLETKELIAAITAAPTVAQLKPRAEKKNITVGLK